jgi:hypothetical protein
MSWAKLLASNRVTQQPSAKAELDSLRSIVARFAQSVYGLNLLWPSHSYAASRQLILVKAARQAI